MTDEPSALPSSRPGRSVALQRAMEPLRLFSLDETNDGGPAPRVIRNTDGPAAEDFDATERYLAEHQERLGAIASIQAAIFLSEASGGIDADTVLVLAADRSRFPRTAAALADTQRWLEGSPGSWPDGFWPQFLLREISNDHGPDQGETAARAA
jgi:hypothetical protein